MLKLSFVIVAAHNNQHYLKKKKKTCWIKSVTTVGTYVKILKLGSFLSLLLANGLLRRCILK